MSGCVVVCVYVRVTGQIFLCMLTLTSLSTYGKCLYIIKIHIMLKVVDGVDDDGYDDNDDDVSSNGCRSSALNIIYTRQQLDTR